MYKIYADDTLIYDSTLDDYIITKGQINLEVNKSGSFVFTIYQDHPYYDRIQKLKTIITVYKNNDIVFRGRVIKDGVGFYKDKTFTCEGELSFLLDTIQRPYAFAGAPADLFWQFIAAHNSQVEPAKRFKIGEVTIVDNNDYFNRSNSAYENTLKNINDHLLGTNSGYLHITRGADGMPTLNWWSDFPYLSGQKIEFGENLLDFVKTNSAGAVASAIIPIGAKLGEDDDVERLTITEINDGKDYVYDELAVQKYGWIFKSVTWDDVTIAENLKKRGQDYLANAIGQSITIELKAIDLSLMDKNIDSFRIGDYIRIVSRPHGLDDMMLLKKQTIDLLNPDNDKITLGHTYSSFTEKSFANNTQNSSLINRVETIENNYLINGSIDAEIEKLKAMINQMADSIVMEVSQKFVTNELLTSEISMLYTQLKNLFEFKFTEIKKEVDENDAENRDKFTTLEKYIRIVDGDIILGEIGSLKISKERISFLCNNVEVLYSEDQRIYVTDAEILNSLIIGKYGFLPRSNDNTTFTKVR